MQTFRLSENCSLHIHPTEKFKDVTMNLDFFLPLDEAAQVYKRMVIDRQGGPVPLIALAKICEHKTRDISAAIEYTRKAILLAADQPDGDMAALQKRYERLMKKARRQT